MRSRDPKTCCICFEGISRPRGQKSGECPHLESDQRPIISLPIFCHLAGADSMKTSSTTHRTSLAERRTFNEDVDREKEDRKIESKP